MCEGRGQTGRGSTSKSVPSYRSSRRRVTRAACLWGGWWRTRWIGSELGLRFRGGLARRRSPRRLQPPRGEEVRYALLYE